MRLWARNLPQNRSELAGTRGLENIKRGIGFMVLSALFFTLLNVCVKMAGDLPVMQKCVFRNAVALMIASFAMWKNRIPLRWPKGSLPLLFTRAVFGMLGMFSNFYAVARLPLGDASALTKLNPVFTVLFCILFLGERCSPIHIIAMALALVSSILIANPSFDPALVVPYLLVIGGTAATGVAYAAIRAMRNRVSGTYIVFFFSVFTTLFTLPFLIFDYHPMTLAQLLWLVAAGAFAAGGQITVTAAYRCAPAQETSVYNYLQVPFSALIGMVFFFETPPLTSVIGYVLIIAIGVGLYLYDRRVYKRKEQEEIIP